MQRLSAAFGWVFTVLAGAAAFLLLAMVVVVSGDIVLRNLSRVTFNWANEVSEIALYLMTLMVAPWLLRRGQHVRLDLVLNMVPARVGWLLEAVGDVLGIAVAIVLLRYGVAMTYDSWRLGSITIKNLVFPEWWLMAPMPVTFTLLGIEFVFRLHRLVAGERRPRTDATSVA